MKKIWNRDFILMLQGNAVSALGSLLYGVAIGYWVYEKTGSSGLMGLMSSISMFVTMLLSPFTGSISDKWDRKWVIVGMDIGRGLIMLAVGALAFANSLSVPIVLIAAFLAALCTVFFDPAVGTLMIDIIPHNDMVRGQSVFGSINSMVNLVGKALSGMLVVFFGVPLIIVINGISYLFSAFTEAFIRVPRTVHQGEKVTIKGLLKDFGTAIRSIFSDPFLRIMVPGSLLMNLLWAGPGSLMLPFCMEKCFTVDMYGWLMSAETAASLLCVLLLGIVKLSPKTRHLLLTLGFTLSVCLSVVAYLSGFFPATCLLIFLISFGNCAANVVLNASLMLALPEGNRGGILGFFNAAATGGNALSCVIYGILGDFFPLSFVFAAGCLLSLPPLLCLCLHNATRNFILEH